MKKLILFCLIVSAFSACKKDDDPTPADPASAVAGSYEVTRIAADFPGDSLDFDEKYPETIGSTTYSGVLNLNKVANSTDRVNLEITERATNQPDAEFFTIDNLEVRSVNNNYELYLGQGRIATATGKNVTFDGVTQDSLRIIVEARR